MANEIIDNAFLINAPAGSGKTTSIRNRLKGISLEKPKSKILCITYTNRAADELKKDLDNENIYVSTIHSYINDLIKPLFAEKEVIDLYWSLYEEEIRKKIKNEEDKANIKESNQKYIDKFGVLSEDVVKMNLVKLYYNETTFLSLYYGGLSHDELLNFTYNLSEKYPMILKKISGKYDYIFIDEYQDTSAMVLKLFYNAVNGNDVKLFLLGDRMQQIYKNYDGSFEEEFKKFDTSERLNINYRSAPQIISILNTLYNDSKFEQEPSEKNNIFVPDFEPEIILTSDMSKEIKEIQSNIPNTLVLYLLNKEKYCEIGSENLYARYSKMDKYSFGMKYSSTDILSDLTEDNPDLLMRYLFSIYQIVKQYLKGNYGNVISLGKRQKKIFDPSFMKINSHKDKIDFKETFDIFVKQFTNEESTIEDILNKLVELKISTKEINEIIEGDMEYTEALQVKIKEVYKLASYLDSPTISTQHGVKGESHESVLFVASNSISKPVVHMYSFYEMWSKMDFSLTELEDFYYEYIKKIREVEIKLGMKTSSCNTKNHNENEINKNNLMNACYEALELFRNCKLFEYLCKEDFDTYLSKPIAGNAKKIFKETKVYGILSAYKLFYVGCSRARRNLSIIVDEGKIAGFRKEFIDKAINTGFRIQEREREKEGLG